MVTVAPVRLALSTSLTVKAVSMAVAAACSEYDSGLAVVVTTGASFTAVTSIVMVFGVASRSTPPFAVPPSS